MLTVDYVAGFFDGEGCVTFGETYGHYYPKMTIVNTDIDIMRALEYTLCIWGIHCKVKVKRMMTKRTRECYIIQLQDMDAIYILCQILRYSLRVKQRRIEVVIKFIETRREAGLNSDKFLSVEEDSVIEVKMLNRGNK